MDHLALLFFEHLLLRADVDDVADVRFRDEGPVRLRLHAEQAHDHAREGEERIDDRRQQPRDALDEWCEDRRPALVVRDGDRLRDDLAEREQQHGHDGGRHERRIGHAGVDEDQRRERIGREQHDGVADEDRCEETVAVLEQPQDRAAALDFPLRHPAGVQPRERDQRRLGTRKECGCEDQDEKPPDLRRADIHTITGITTGRECRAGWGGSVSKSTQV